MVSSLWAAQSQVAFTSREEMNRHSADVQKNVMYRNPGNVEGTEQCEYIREYVIKYALNNHQHTSIWYYVMQCYDKDFKQVGDDLYSFNYDGNAEKLFKLPPGCPPPVVEDKKKNPCENGIALGDQLYKDITEITTKKLTEHPLSAINGQPKEEPKGTTTEKKENGDVVVTSPDGTVKTNKPDGSSTTTYPDGTLEEVTKDNVKTVTTKDGTTHVKKPDGSTKVTLEDGTTYEETPERTTTVKKPDGTVHTQDTKGNTTVTDPNGDKHTTNPDGTVEFEPENDEEVHNVNEDGSTEVTLKDGTKFTEKKDKTTVVEEPNGTTHTTDENENILIERPDDSKVEITPVGVTVLTLPDNTTVTTTPSTKEGEEPTVVIRDPKGTEVPTVVEKPVVTENPEEETKTTQMPDGSVVEELKDGTTVLSKPDGCTIITNPDESTTEFLPNGSVNKRNPKEEIIKVYEPNGTTVEELEDKSVLTTKPDGTSVEERPDKTVVTRKPDGSSVEKKPDGTVLTRNPDGSTVEEKPDKTVIKTKPNGSSVEERPDKVVVETTPDGRVTTIVPKPTEEDPKNVEVSVVYPDGTKSPEKESPADQTIVDAKDKNITTEEGMDKVIKQIPELEEKLEEVLKNSMKENPTPVSNKVDPDGTRTVVYQYPNGTETTVVEKKNGDKVSTTVQKPSGEINVVEYKKESNVLVKTLKDPEGKVKSYSTHEPKPDHPNTEVVTYFNDKGVQVGLPEEREAKYDFMNPSELTNLDVSPELEKLFKDAAENFSETLESYVDNNVKCFLENVFKQRENYLTFVCAHSEQKSIKDLLFAKFGENTICNKIKCEELERELIDRMLEASNAGKSMDDIEVVSNNYKTEIVDGETKGKVMDKAPTFEPKQ